MLLLSGRLGLILTLASLFLSAGGSGTSLAHLPPEVVRTVDLLAVYGLATVVTALVIRTFNWLRRTLAEMGEGD